MQAHAQTPHGAVNRYAATRFGINSLEPARLHRTGRRTIQGTDVHGGRFLAVVDCDSEGWHVVSSYGAHVRE